MDRRGYVSPGELNHAAVGLRSLALRMIRDGEDPKVAERFRVTARKLTARARAMEASGDSSGKEGGDHG